MWLLYAGIGTALIIAAFLAPILRDSVRDWNGPPELPSADPVAALPVAEPIRQARRDAIAEAEALRSAIEDGLCPACDGWSLAGGEQFRYRVGGPSGGDVWEIVASCEECGHQARVEYIR